MRWGTLGTPLYLSGFTVSICGGGDLWINGRSPEYYVGKRFVNFSLLFKGEGLLPLFGEEDV